ncbi:hypothetical protein Pan153_52130 [Gimesia panareensis]|uniref:Uncharacterized protein n=1 Tax=Gimesia panareensis TaxID=2527978 RepID=A0A518FW15_9PLAN|nr:hypothetical protein Pan153_52130 [Gimesia panareensis]
MSSGIYQINAEETSNTYFIEYGKTHDVIDKLQHQECVSFTGVIKRSHVYGVAA